MSHLITILAQFSLSWAWNCSKMPPLHRMAIINERMPTLIDHWFQWRPCATCRTGTSKSLLDRCSWGGIPVAAALCLRDPGYSGFVFRLFRELENGIFFCYFEEEGESIFLQQKLFKTCIICCRGKRCEMVVFSRSYF